MFELTSRRATALNLTLALAWTAFALALLPGHGHFLEDEAVAWHGALAVVQNGRLAGYGPLISGTNPGLYVPGGAFFDLLALAFLWTTSPLAGSVWIVLLAGLGLVLFDRALARLSFTPALRVAALVLYAFGIWHARNTDRMWAVNSFPFLAPLLLYAAARAVTGTPRSRLWAAPLLGMAVGICLQPHLSGVLAVGMTGLLVLTQLKGRPVREIALLAGLAAVGFALTYVPYVLDDAAHGFWNTLHLGGGRKGSHEAIGRTLATFATFSSQSDPFKPERFAGPLVAKLGTLTFYVAIGLCVIGAVRRSPVRWMALGGFLLVPLFFAAINRDYHTNYLAAGGPFYVLPAAVALDALWATRARWLVPAYLAAFIALGVVDVCDAYTPETPQFQIADQIAIATELATRTPSAHLVPESEIESQGLIYEWLAKDVLHRPLSMSGDTPCGVFSSEAAAARHGASPSLVGRQWVVCRRIVSDR